MSAVQEEDNLTEEQAEQFLERHAVPTNLRQTIMADVRLANAIQKYVLQVAERLKNGDKTDTWETMAAEIDRIAAEHGQQGGIPLPAIDEDGSDREHPLVLARRSPLSWIINMNQASTELAQRVAAQQKHVINSWRVLGDHEVCIVRTEEGPMWIKYPGAGGRFRKLMDGLIVRSSLGMMTAEAELKAVESLKGRITAAQYRSYVLNGAFLERSKRSDIFYVFRKGYPTLAISFHGEQQGKLLAALCFHPHGFYQYTHTGVMCPTDEVISALLMMRGDERKFWAKSGQWHAADSRSGL